MKLYIKELVKKFGDQEVLKNIEFTFEKNSIFGLLGRNGAGKTTLFNCITEEIKRESGKFEIELEDGTIRELKPSDVGYVYSTPILPEFLTGYEFLKFYLEIKHRERKSKEEIFGYFKLVELSEDDAFKLITNYSHGMKNKLQILCVLISKPKIILLDEPLTSFDVVVALEMKNILKSLKNEHIIIFSTHILELAKDLCDDIVILHQGELRQLDMSVVQGNDFEDELIKVFMGGEDHE